MGMSMSFTRTAFCVLLIALPWLWPSAGGPSPLVEPGLLTLLCAALLMLAARQKALAPLAAQAWWLAALLSACMALLQYSGLADAFAPWVNPAPYDAPYANIRQRNQFASFTLIGLAAGLFLATRPANRWRDLALLLGAVLLSAGNVVSGSRVGFVGLMLLCALAWVWRHSMNEMARRMLLAAVLAYGLLSLALPWLTDGLFALARIATERPDCNSRLVLWRNVLHLINLHPWTGWGWGELNYAHYITLYEEPRFCAPLGNAHNLPLHLAVELGLPLALLICGALAWMVWRARPWRETDPARQMAWAVISLIGLHSALEFPLWYGPFQMALGLSVLLLLPAGAVRISGRMKTLVALSLVASALLVWGDYRRVSQVFLARELRTEEMSDTEALALARTTWLFHNFALFAEVNMTPLTPENAQWIHRAATHLLHFSPQSQVVEKVIESAVALGNSEIAFAHLERYKAANPEKYKAWAKTHISMPSDTSH